MRVDVDFYKLITKLTPHYFGGVKFIGFMQSLVAPLQSANRIFKIWANETKISANMTSQVIMLEWYLERELKELIADPTTKFKIVQFIRDTDSHAVTVQDNNSQLSRQFRVSDTTGSTISSKFEWAENEQCSFVVIAPHNNASVSTAAYVQQISNIVNLYRLAGKTFKIIVSDL